MKNNNFSENMKYLLIGLLIMGVFALFIIHRQRNEPQPLITCDCTETLGAVLDEKFSSRAESTSEPEPSPEKITEPENSESSSIPRQAINPTPTKFRVGEPVPVPTLPTNVKTFTDYRSYNLVRTPHYRLQQVAYTDNNGLRRFNQDYIVAMGAFYSVDIGDRFKVTLDTGNEFSVILGDGKHPADCDPTNMYDPCINYNGENCANVLEFIIDSDVMSPNVYSYGSIDCIDGFGGNIVKMEYLGRDQSADWTTYETK